MRFSDKLKCFWLCWSKTDSAPNTFCPKPPPTRGAELPFKYLNDTIRLKIMVTSLTRCRFGSRSEIQLASCSGQAKTLLRWNISDPVAFCVCSLKLGSANLAKEPIWYASQVRAAQFQVLRVTNSFPIKIDSKNGGGWGQPLFTYSAQINQTLLTLGYEIFTKKCWLKNVNHCAFIKVLLWSHGQALGNVQV